MNSPRFKQNLDSALYAIFQTILLSTSTSDSHSADVAKSPDIPLLPYQGLGK